MGHLVIDARVEVCWSGVMERSETSISRLRPSTDDSIRTTPTESDKIVPLAADGVESISERPCRYQVWVALGGGAAERAALRYL